MSNYTRYPDPAGGIKIYPSAIDFPINPGKDGVQAVAADTNTIYIFDTATNSWQAVANPGAAIAIDALNGDVSATGPGVVNATVNSVGGAAAADIASATNDVLAATDLATPSTLVKRDANANSAFNVLKVNDGTVLAPSFTFSNSLSTGLYSSAANTLNLSTNGVERMAITSSGNVGIGISNPNSKLYVVNSGTQLGLAVYSTSTNNTAELYNQGTTNYTLALNSASNSAQTGASIGGYFARGTLSARAQTLANDSLLSISASGHTGSSFAGISAAVVLAADENTGAAAYGGQIVFATTPNSTPGGVPIPRMYVKNDGKVNIPGLTASQLIATDSSQNLQSLTTATYPSLTEISYVKGVTSSIQTQLNNKQPLAKVDRITKSIDYNLASSDDYIGCDTSLATVTLTLPAANSVPSGKKYIIKDEGGNAGTFSIFIAPSGTDTIDGVNASENINVGYESLTLVCNGADAWFII